MPRLAAAHLIAPRLIASRLIAPALVAALGCGLFAAPAAAGDRTPTEVVRELVRDLGSEDPGVREEARRRAFALGVEARAALERITRGSDPHAAARALNLLADPRWKKGAAGDAPMDERQTAPRPRDTELPVRLNGHLKRLRGLLDHKGFEAWHRRVVKDLPDHIELDLKQLLTDGQLSGKTVGRVEQNGRRFAWKEDGTGAIRVRVRDGKDAEDVLFEASSIEMLRKKAPAVAKRLDEIRAKHGAGGFTVRLRPHDLRVELGEGLRDLRIDEARLRGYLDRVKAGFAESTHPLLSRLRRPGSARRVVAPRKPLLGIEWTSPTPALRAQLDIETGGMQIQSVRAGTPAGRLGIRKHDVLVELAGRRVATSADVRLALGSIAAGETLRAIVVRAGKRVELSTTR